jgi:ADP-heptose:LPS heptosyltransferase
LNFIQVRGRNSMRELSAPFPVPPFTPEGVIGVPLSGASDPDRVILIRFHAIGDTAITFPVLGALRRRLPGSRLEVVTDVRSASLFEAHRDVEAVHALDMRRGKLPKAQGLLRLAIALWRGPRPVVLNLQRDRWSLILGRLLAPRAWAGFDRFAPRTALTRYLDAVEGLGLGRLDPVLEPRLRPGLVSQASERLRAAGLDPARPLVCLNPAGGWETKQWPIERYVELGRRLHDEAACQLMALSAAPVPRRFRELKAGLGRRLVDLTGTTTLGLTLALLTQVWLMVTDDSGLMHLAWVQGVPTLALFGASRSTWSRPEGPGSTGFYSEDLSCGACMQPVCAQGDLRCLGRVPVDEVTAAALRLMRRDAA